MQGIQYRALGMCLYIKLMFFLFLYFQEPAKSITRRHSTHYLIHLKQTSPRRIQLNNPVTVVQFAIIVPQVKLTNKSSFTYSQSRSSTQSTNHITQANHTTSRSRGWTTRITCNLVKGPIILFSLLNLIIVTSNRKPIVSKGIQLDCKSV